MSRLPSVKLRSLSLCTTVLALAATSAGCVMESHSYANGCVEDEWGDLVCSETVPAPAASTAPPNNEPATSPRTVAIETGRTLEAPAGEGVGLFVEYQAGGRWHLHTTCDTSQSGYSCDFDVYATVDTSGTIAGITAEGLEPGDVAVRSNTTAHFAARTATGAQGVWIDAWAGASIALEVYLDGVLEPRYVYWRGDGVVHAGAPTNPVVFQPSTP